VNAMLRPGSYAGFAALLALGGAALADPAPAPQTTSAAPAPEATTTSVTTAPAVVEPPASNQEPNLTVLPKPVPSPLHPRRRLTKAMSISAGAYCPDVGSRTVTYGHFCAAQLRLAMDSRMGDMHGAVLIGDALRVGFMGGFELGSPYFQLGPRRSRVAMAIRGSFDGVISKLGQHVPGRYSDGYLAFSNTYGPNLSIAMNPNSAFELRGAVGWTVAGFFSDHDGFDHRPVYGIVAEGWLGVRFSP